MNNAAKKNDAESVEQPKTTFEVVKKDESAINRVTFKNSKAL